MGDSAQAFQRLERKLEEYHSLQDAVEGGGDSPQAELSQRIQQKKNTTVNQHRHPKGAGISVEWRELSAASSSAPAAPAARVGMTLTRLGSGTQARIILFGGFEDTGDAAPSDPIPSNLNPSNPIQSHLMTSYSAPPHRTSYR